MINSTESLISLTDAAKRLPGRPNTTTLWRWRQRGVRGVRLETILIGGRRMTSVEALDRFFAASTAAADGEPLPAGQTPRQRELAIAAAERQAEKLGV